MAGTRRRSHALVDSDDDVALLPASDPSGAMSDPRVTSSTRPTTTTAAEQPPAGLSLTQVSGGALAPVTAAVAASFLGVGGTLTGAAVGSVVSTIAAVLYSNSLSHAARVSRTMVVRQTLAPAAAKPQSEAGEPDGEPQPQPVLDPLWQRIRWKPVLLVAAGVFVAAMVVITGSELLLGHPIGNAGESGTTVSHLRGSSSQPSQTPTPTPTGTPSSSATATPTPTASGTPTDASPNPTASSPSTSSPTLPQTTAPTTAPSTATTAPTGG
jgi:hypothetical protein